MLPAFQIQEWLNTLEPDAPVGIDEGGLTLIAHDLNNEPTGAYLEVGGISNEEE